MRRAERYQLYLEDVLRGSFGFPSIVIRGVHLDAKVSCSFSRLGESGEPELTSTEVGPVYLCHEYLSEPFLLDQTNLTHVHKLLYEDFVTEVERLAIEFANGPKAKWEYDDVVDVADAGDERD